jgi:hypothetical protein
MLEAQQGSSSTLAHMRILQTLLTAAPPSAHVDGTTRLNLWRTCAACSPFLLYCHHLHMLMASKAQALAHMLNMQSRLSAAPP